jgi:hypothetical protein
MGPSPNRSAPAVCTVDTIDHTLFLPCIWIVCSLGFSLGDVPLLFLLIPPLCVTYAIIRLTASPRLLTWYVALCAVAGILSFYRLFPHSWQTQFLEEAVPRQLAPIISFFTVAWASKAYFRRRLRTGDIFAEEWPVLILGYIVAPIVMLLTNVRYQEDDSTSTMFAAYGACINNVVIGQFFILGRLFLPKDWSRLAAGTIILLVAVTTHFVQFKLIAAAAMLMLIGFPPRSVLVGIMMLLVVSYGVEMINIPAAIMENPNKGIRAAFIADTFRSLFDTHGIGIGYGTESVRWVYRFPGLPDFTFMPNPATVSRERLLELLSRGVHNSFAQAMLRTGIPGIVLLTCAFFAAFPPRGLSRRMQCHACMLFLMIFVACFVNPALESPVQLVGIGFVYGYLLALRAHVRSARALTRFSVPVVSIAPTAPAYGATGS